VEIIKILLDKEMCVDLSKADDFTPLHVSALYGNLEATKTFVESGAVLDKANEDCFAPMILAAFTCKLEILCYLTEIDNDMNIRDVSRNTALHFAAFSGSVEITTVFTV
jgi:ankyrin repeat protein